MPAGATSEGKAEFSLVALTGRQRAAQHHFGNRVFLGVFDDRTIVLNLRRDRYFFLLNAEHQAVCETLPLQFESPLVLSIISKALRNDFGAFLSQELGAETPALVVYDYRGRKPGRGLDAFSWQDRFGLIVREIDGSAADTVERRTYPQTLYVYWKLVLFGFLCRIGHTRPAISGFAKKTKQRPTNGQEKTIANVVRHINRCMPFVPFQIECLPYAAALGSILRAKGIDAYLVIGVRSIPFEAHAWIEVEGKIVGERPGLRQDLNVLFDTRWLIAAGSNDDEETAPPFRLGPAGSI